MTFRRFCLALGLTLTLVSIVSGCGLKKEANQAGVESSAAETSQEVGESTEAKTSQAASESVEVETSQEVGESAESETSQAVTETAESETNLGTEEETLPLEVVAEHEVAYDLDWQYADYSAICDDCAMFYPATGNPLKNITVCVNAGHGTSGGSGASTYSHPDQTPKCTGGTNAEGAVKSMAIAEGTDMADGTPESKVTLKLAMVLKEELLEAGYNVLMIRESEDVQLDNIARTVLANNNADCHIALHYDSTNNDKGVFYISVPDIDSYRSMEPVASMWEEHDRLGRSLIEGLDGAGLPIWSSGSMALDLTQTSYSTIPSVDLEVGDRGSDYGEDTLRKISEGIVDGLDMYYQ